MVFHLCIYKFLFLHGNILVSVLFGQGLKASVVDRKPNGARAFRDGP